MRKAGSDPTMFTLRELPKYELIAKVAEQFPLLSPDMIQCWLVFLKTSSALFNINKCIINCLCKGCVLK